MRKTANIIQATYLLALVALEAVMQEQIEQEAAFCRKYGYLDEHGNPAGSLYQIEYDVDFVQADEDFHHSDAGEALETRIVSARESLHAAEESLIDFALSIMPACFAKQRDALDRNRNKLDIRKKILNTAAKLDVSTLSAKVR